MEQNMANLPEELYEISYKSYCELFSKRNLCKTENKKPSDVGFYTERDFNGVLSILAYKILTREKAPEPMIYELYKVQFNYYLPIVLKEFCLSYRMKVCTSTEIRNALIKCTDNNKELAPLLLELHHNQIKEAFNNNTYLPNELLKAFKEITYDRSIKPSLEFLDSWSNSTNMDKVVFIYHVRKAKILPVVEHLVEDFIKSMPLPLMQVFYFYAFDDSSNVATMKFPPEHLRNGLLADFLDDFFSAYSSVQLAQLEKHYQLFVSEIQYNKDIQDDAI